jgi:hypothetical protein
VRDAGRMEKAGAGVRGEGDMAHLCFFNLQIESDSGREEHPGSFSLSQGRTLLLSCYLCGGWALSLLWHLALVLPVGFPCLYPARAQLSVHTDAIIST